jgi:hypothetical protein
VPHECRRGSIPLHSDMVLLSQFVTISRDSSAIVRAIATARRMYVQKDPVGRCHILAARR